jgi:methionine--tRNA ligase beta chain
MINYEEFRKLELKVGKIISAVPVEKSEKLLQLQVDFGSERRQVVSGIAKSYSPEDLVDKKFVFVTNLAPRSIMGLESQAMILAADSESGPVCLIPSKDVEPGTEVL